MRINLVFLKIVAAFLFATGLYISLAAGVSADSTEPEESGTYAFQRESTALFEKTGLLAHPGETAAQILLRAHKREPDAMVLAALGYAWGVCGFPPNMFMAFYWTAELEFFGDKATEGLFAVLLWQEYELDASFGGVLARCALARKSPYLNALKGVGFEFEKICSGTEEDKPNFPGWEIDYEKYMTGKEKRNKERLAFAALMRELRSRPATLDEQDKIKRFVWDYSDMLLFFAATSHDPGKEIPDWSADRLTDFLVVQREQLEKEHQAGKQDMRPEFIALIHEAAALLARRPPGTPGNMDTLIRNAHLGDVTSIRRVAEHYANGTAGFIKSEALSNCWLRLAAMYSDREAALVSAIQLYTRGNLDQAWAWASIFLMCEELDAISKASAQNLLAKIEAIQGEDKACERESVKTVFLNARDTLLKWRFGGKENRRAGRQNKSR
ncbi:MAG: hypothetical protein LBC94_01355 [Desulfovibrio sp.]|nr:hypothetical protein [Desulfovibrio sp.]